MKSSWIDLSLVWFALAFPNREFCELWGASPLCLPCMKKDANSLSLFEEPWLRIPLVHSNCNGARIRTNKVFRKQIAEHCTYSGKKKAHKHESFWPVTPPVTGGVSRPGGQGSKFYVLSSEPKEHRSFCPDTRPGGLVTGASGKCFMCKSCMCLFCSLLTLSPHTLWALASLISGPKPFWLSFPIDS